MVGSHKSKPFFHAILHFKLVVYIVPIYYTLYSTFFVKPHELEDLIKSYPKSLINCSNFLLIPSPWQFTSTSGSEMVGGRYASSALKMEKIVQ